jgi:hypothetical protein
MNLGIMVCVTLIFKAFEYVALNCPLFHNVFLEIILFNLFIPGGVTQFPSKLVPFKDEFPLCGSMKFLHPFLPYLPFFIIIPLIFPYLALWEEGVKGPEGTSSWKELKPKIKPLRCFAHRFLRKQ